MQADPNSWEKDIIDSLTALRDWRKLVDWKAGEK
jgi:hypothetical protein